jgi:hypothetical protein
MSCSTLHAVLTTSNQGNWLSLAVATLVRVGWLDKAVVSTVSKYSSDCIAAAQTALVFQATTTCTVRSPLSLLLVASPVAAAMTVDRSAK